MGRNQKTYKYLGETIVGLSKISANRWRISQTGERFTEAGEYTAVQYFKQQVMQKHDTLFIPIATGTPQQNTDVIDALDGIAPEGLEIQTDEGTAWDEDDVEHAIGHRVDRRAFFQLVRHLIITQPEFVAQETGIPQLGMLNSLAFPPEALSLDDIREAYKEFSTAKRSNSKVQTLKAWDRMVEFCEAKVLPELTTEKLLAYADEIANDASIPAGSTKRMWFRRPKTILGFAMKRGLDATQIRVALDKMKVMDPKRFALKYRPPNPIKPEIYRKLLDAAVGEWAEWRIRLLLGMNLCIYLMNLSELRWEMLDMEKGTYSTIRGKTEDDRVPQCACLWSETLAELNALKRTASPYVLVSRHGDGFHKTTLSNDFNAFAKHAGVKAQWNMIRDGAYTVALEEAEEKWARVLAGHRAEGLMDNCVMRNAIKTKEACEAVHRAYFGKA